jgi:hypothetical protein
LTQAISITTSYDQYRCLAAGELLSFPGSIFYNPEFIIISAEILDLEPHPIALLEDDRVAGFANFMLNCKFGVKTMTIPKFYQYYGPVILKPTADFNAAIEKYLKQNSDLAVFSLVPEFAEQFNSDSWKKIDRLTYYLKPDTYENLRKNCFDDVKNKLNKAMKSGIEVKQIDDFPYDVYEASFKRQGLNPPMEESRLVSWISKLVKSGMARTFAAYKSNELLAFRTQLIANGFAYDWLAGAHPEANSLGVNQLLILTIGQELFNAKIINWDLLGGDIKSIGDFKRSFGSIPRHHAQIERAFSLKGKIYRSLMKLKESGNA